MIEPEDRTIDRPRPTHRAQTTPLGELASASRGDDKVVRKAPELKLRDLNAYYGSAHAVKNVSLDVAPNQVTAMIGPSGSGQVDGRAVHQPHA